MSLSITYADGPLGAQILGVDLSRDVDDAAQFVYGHRWQVGDLLIWDNAATQHRATCDYALPQRRLMHRTATAGEAALGIVAQ